MFSTYRKRRSLCTSSLEAIRSAKRRRLENNIKYKASVRKKEDILRKQSNVNKKSSLSFQNNKPTHDTLVQPTNILKNLPLMCSLERAQTNQQYLKIPSHMNQFETKKDSHIMDSKKFVTDLKKQKCERLAANLCQDKVCSNDNTITMQSRTVRRSLNKSSPIAIKCARQRRLESKKQKQQRKQSNREKMKEERLNKHMEHLDFIRIGNKITEKELLEKLEACKLRPSLLSCDEKNDANVSEDNENDEEPNDDENNNYIGSGESFFDDIIKNPSKSLLLFYLNSGCMRFQEYKNYSEAYNGQPLDMDSLIEEIKNEKVTEEEKKKMIKEFLQEYSYTSAKLPSCGACGIRLFESSYKKSTKFPKLYLNSEKAQVLAYTEKETKEFCKWMNSPLSKVEIPCDDDFNTETVEIWKCKSVFLEPTNSNQSESNVDTFTYWHLHPELVKRENNNEYSTLICPSCNSKLKKGKRPKLSIAAGIDFGRYTRIKGLIAPNLHEQMILSRARMFYCSTKVAFNNCGVTNRNTGSHFKIHTIIFPHDAPEKAAYMFNPRIHQKDGLLDLENLKGMIHVLLLDSSGNMDALFESVHGYNHLYARPHVIAQWILVLQRCHTYYKDLIVGDLTKTISATTEYLNKYIKQNISKVTDSGELEREKELGADVAEVQNVSLFSNKSDNQLDLEDLATQAEQENGPIPISYSYVTNNSSVYLSEDKEDFRYRCLEKFVELNEPDADRILQTQNGFVNTLFDENVMEEYLHRYPMSMQASSFREKQPFHDFQKDDKAISTCFPHVFMLGKVYGKAPGSLTLDERVHLLSQFTTIPSTDKRLLGFLTDVMQRMEVIHGVQTYIESNPNSILEIEKLLNDPEKKAELKSALAWPYGIKEKRIINQVLGHLRFAGKDIMYGPLEGTKLKHRAIGETKRFNPCTVFLTISPNNLDNPRAIRSAYESNDNESFPCQFQADCPMGANGIQFMQSFKEQNERETNDSASTENTFALSKSLRAKMSINNPVAFVMENKKLLFHIFQNLFGLTLEGSGFYSQVAGSTQRKTRFFKSKKGIMGYATNAYGVTESHSRGTLHWHILVNTGLSPELLERFAHNPGLCSEIAGVIDSMYQSELPMNVNAHSILKNLLWRYKSRWQINDEVCNCLNPTNPFSIKAEQYASLETEEHNPLCNSQWIQHQINHQAGEQNYHNHRKGVCTTGTKGFSGCRLDLRQPLISCTRNTKLITPCESNIDEDISSNAETSTNSDNLSNQELQRNNQVELEGNNILTSNQEEIEDDKNPIDKRSYVAVPMQKPRPLQPIDFFEYCNLKNILYPPDKKSIMIWETRRPVHSHTLLNTTINQEDDFRKHTITTFRKLLSGTCTTGSEESSNAFWNWLQNDTSSEQLHCMFKSLQQQLPISNGYVATFCPALSFCTGSHNNASLLGSSDQSKAAFFYLIPYAAKPKFPLQHSLTVINECIPHIIRHASTASDSGTIERTVKHLMQRALNQLSLLSELSDYEMIAALIKLPSVIECDKTILADPLAMATLPTRLDLYDDLPNTLEKLSEALQKQRNATRTIGRSVMVIPEENLDDVKFNEMALETAAKKNLFTILPSKALQLFLEFLCGNPPFLKLYQERGVIFFLADPRFYLTTLKNTFYVRTTLERAFEKNIYNNPIPYEDHSIQTNLGFIKKYTINISTDDDDVDNPNNPPRSVLLPITVPWYFRSPLLEDISYYESLACFDFHNEKPGEREDKPYNLKALQEYKLDPRSNLFADSFHVIKKKQCTPLAIGKVPNHPGTEEKSHLPNGNINPKYAKWKIQADKFASYYLAYFRPFSCRTTYSCDWNALVEWIQFLQGDTSNIISQFRLMIMDRHMYGIKSNETCKQMARDYRSRTRDLWSDKEKSEIMQDKLTAIHNIELNAHNSNELNALQKDPISHRRLQNMVKQDAFDQQQQQCMETLFDFTENITIHNSEKYCTQWITILNHCPVRQTQATLDHMKAWIPNDESNLRLGETDEDINHSIQMKIAARNPKRIEEGIQNIRSKLEGTDNSEVVLHKQQLEFFDCFVHHYLGFNFLTSKSTPTKAFPNLVLVHGGPGTGKSFLRDAIADVCTLTGHHTLKVSFNGLNAAEMGGEILCYWINESKPQTGAGCKLNENLPLKNAQVLRADGFGERSVVINDEAQTSADWHIQKLSQLCQQVTGKTTEPYGGATAIYFGDYGQVGPVKAGGPVTKTIMDKYLHENLKKQINKSQQKKIDNPTIAPSRHAEDDKFNVNSLQMRGMKLVAECRWYELNTQIRSHDDVHNAMVRKLYHGKQIQMEDFKNNGYKLLSKEDCQTSEWTEASLLVSTNRQRYTFTPLKAIAYAKNKIYKFFDGDPIQKIG